MAFQLLYTKNAKKNEAEKKARLLENQRRQQKMKVYETLESEKWNPFDARKKENNKHVSDEDDDEGVADDESVADVAGAESSVDGTSGNNEGGKGGYQEGDSCAEKHEYDEPFYIDLTTEQELSLQEQTKGVNTHENEHVENSQHEKSNIVCE